MTVAYDGSGFYGFVENRGVHTVAAALRQTLERVLGHTVKITCAGRTDKGVHAQGQVISFDIESDRVSVGDLGTAVTRMCGPEVVVRSAEVVADDFDARFSARSRIYRYTVLQRPVPDPFLASTTWHVAAPLDLRAMVLACDPFIGLHDFSSFCRRIKPKDPSARPRSLERRVIRAEWRDVGDDLLRFEIEASSFCQQMVRSLVATMVEVGHGNQRAGDMMGVMAAADRPPSTQPAPPQGLCLWEVTY
jgi:tRNA pseudouridine38-40 synthase